MNFFLFGFLEALVLVTALSVDAFVAGFAYGANRVKIPVSSMAVIDLLSGGILLIFLMIGKLLGPFVPEGLIRIFCFAVLFGLGMVKIFDSSIKTLIRRSGKQTSEISFSLLEFCFILTIYADPDKADADQSGILTPREAVSLGTALSLDSAAAGLGAGAMTSNPVVTAVMALAVGAAAILAGSLLGNRLAEKLSLNFSWVGGFLLVILAFMKFF